MYRYLKHRQHFCILPKFSDSLHVSFLLRSAGKQPWGKEAESSAGARRPPALLGGSHNPTEAEKTPCILHKAQMQEPSTCKHFCFSVTFHVAKSPTAKVSEATGPTHLQGPRTASFVPEAAFRPPSATPLGWLDQTQPGTTRPQPQWDTHTEGSEGGDL